MFKIEVTNLERALKVFELKSNISLFQIYNSGCIFLFSALSLVVPSGYSYAAVLLLLGSFVYLLSRPTIKLNRGDKYLISALLLYFSVSFFSNYVNHFPLSSYDRSFRFLFVIPVYLLLIAYPPRQVFFWSGLIFGAIGACALAFHQRFFEGGTWWRPGGYTNPIQFGDISLLMGLFLIMGIVWCVKYKRNYFLLPAFLIGSIAGIAASLMSSSRGGWLALPFVLPVFLSCLGVRFSRSICIIPALAIGIVFIYWKVLPSDNFFTMRIDQTFIELSTYYHDKDVYSSFSTRMKMWAIGLNAFTIKPLFGWGDLNAIKAYFPLQWQSLNSHDNYNHLHNEYIDELAKRGLIGFFSLSLLYFLPLRYFFIAMTRNINTSQLVFGGTGVVLIFCTMIFGLTQVFTLHNSGTIVFLFYLIIIMSYCRQGAI